jgi:hypothetical protein
VDELARTWLDALMRRSEGAVPAIELYAGRAFSDAKAVTASVGGRLAVVSAGLGLVDGYERAPLYELTVADGPGSVTPRLASLGASSKAWWRAVNVARSGDPCPLARRLTGGLYTAILVALPANYMELIGEDLEAIPGSARSALRIFTSHAGRDKVPELLRPNVLPYDERLDGEGSPRQGTRVDFPQRAMRHYVEDLDALGLPLAEGCNRVVTALSRLVRPSVPVRRRATDEELLELLRLNWTAYHGQSSKLLRFLRDEARVACEQSRFRVLWSQARNERTVGAVGQP